MPGHRIAPAAGRLQQVWCVIGEADGRPILRRVDRWGNIRGVGLTGHASDAMLSVYARPRSLFDQSAGGLFNDVGEGER